MRVAPHGSTAAMSNLIERKALKLLTQAGMLMNEIAAEGLCEEPHRTLMQTILAELLWMLD
jgi:hypothetical protein